MKRVKILIAVIPFFMLFFFGIFNANQALAENKGVYIFSAESNCIWSLSKETKKVMFIQFKDDGSIWKSNIGKIPDEFNLNESEIKAVGSRGTSLFVYDKSQGLVTIFQAVKDQSIKTFPIVNTSIELK